MTFKRITNELYGAKNAGYRIDKSQTAGMDPEAMKILQQSMGDRYVDDLIDSMYDFDGDAYEGDDGRVYIVKTAYVNGVEMPVAWHQLTR